MDHTPTPLRAVALVSHSSGLVSELSSAASLISSNSGLGPAGLAAIGNAPFNGSAVQF